jgi:hypothetical protein
MFYQLKIDPLKWGIKTGPLNVLGVSLNYSHSINHDIVLQGMNNTMSTENHASGMLVGGLSFLPI